MASSNNKEEPRTAPEPERWYNLTLGSSFADQHHSPKFCTLRYEFKPASIDKNQPGSLHKNKDNRVTAEFHSNQHGKPKLMFEGISEDYKENDAVLFFDGETLRLERLHRAVKSLRHVRLPGESVATTATAIATPIAPMVESGSPQLDKGTKFQSLNKDILHQTPVELERNDINKSEILGGGKTTSVNDVDPSSSHPNLPTVSSDPKEDYELEEQIDILNDSDDDGYKTNERGDVAEREFTTGIDINIPHQVDMDDEMADVDVSGDEAESGPNAAEALRAQVNAEGRGNPTSSSSSSSSSGSESESESGSGSGSSSSSSDSQSGDGDGDGDSVNSI